MLRLALGAAIMLAAASAGAQRVPGRDLLHFPLGLAAEPAALGGGAASGLWNPATAVLRPGERARIALSGLSAPIDVALSGQVIHGAYRAGSAGTAFAGITRAAIQDLVHTETDPQSIGNDIAYATWVVSGGFARRFGEHLTAAAALRWHTGHVYTSQASALGADVGVVADGLTDRDVRAGAATYLFRPGGNASPSYSAAVDARVAGRDTLRTVRAGISAVHTAHGPREQYPYVDARFDKVNLRGGFVRLDAYGSATWRARLALLLRHGGYLVSIAREENANGLTASYQLGVASVIR